MGDKDPGVPQALPRALRKLVEAVGVQAMDRLWLFPPLRNGRKETGVVAAGCYTEGDGRLLVTLAYRAEETGKGVAFESTFQEEGEAPRDRLPRIMSGVVQRMENAPGEPRLVELEGSEPALQALLAELDPFSQEDPVHPGPRPGARPQTLE